MSSAKPGDTQSLLHAQLYGADLPGFSVTEVTDHDDPVSELLDGCRAYRRTRNTAVLSAVGPALTRGTRQASSHGFGFRSRGRAAVAFDRLTRGITRDKVSVCTYGGVQRDAHRDGVRTREFGLTRNRRRVLGRPSQEFEVDSLDGHGQPLRRYVFQWVLMGRSVELVQFQGGGVHWLVRRRLTLLKTVERRLASQFGD